MRIAIWVVVVLAAAVACYVAGIAVGLYGRDLGPGTATALAVPDAVVDG